MIDDLPITEEQWAKVPRPVPLDPDKTDLYHASHRSLMPCPFCGKHPILAGKLNEQTGIYGYEVICDPVYCGVVLFANGRNRNEARELAIKKWSTRCTKEPS
jgi:hypothetical protein